MMRVARVLPAALAALVVPLLMGQTTQRGDEDRKAVLKIAATCGESAREKLRVFAASSASEEAARRLAQAVLSSWDAHADCFLSAVPRPAVELQLRAEEIRKVAPQLKRETLVSILVSVDETGAPTRAKVLMSSGNSKLDDLGVKTALAAPYVPKREPDGYKKGEVVITFPIEIR